MRFRPHEIDREGAARALDQARDAGIALPTEHHRDVVATLGAAGAGVWPALQRVPHALDAISRELATRGGVEPARIAAPPDATAMPDLDGAKRALRQMRDEALVRTALRELYARVDVDTTAREWSTVVDGCCAWALAVAQHAVESRNGVPCDEAGARVPFVVLGMGKLGGHELNLGSDIDVCFFYGTDEGAAGTRTLNQHFGRVGIVLSELLGEVTADGFAFRVDLRLRPEGSRGPVANSLASAERYYETWGRPWERAALLRARPIAGDVALGETLLRELRPFIYRRTVDPSIAGEIDAMLQRARREQLRDDARDLKLGRGGIREVEFFVQSLQLVWGGLHPRLQVPGTLAALQQLRALGLVSHRESDALDDAWALLRRVEHRVQVMTPYATHEIPEAGPRLDALARSLGYARGDALVEALDAARTSVRTLYESAQPRDAKPHGDDTPLRALARAVSTHSVAELAELAGDALGVDDPEHAAENLARLARRADLPLAPGMLARYPDLGAHLLEGVHDAPDPDMALRHLADLFDRLRPAEPYARLLAEQPTKARGLLGVFGASEHLARTLLARPSRIDLVVSGGDAPSTEEIARLVDDALARGREALADDPEAAVGMLRVVLREITLAIGLADMAGTLTRVEVTARLSALAEGVIRASLTLAEEECAARFGRPEQGLAVVAMGSLAARELGYGGDLDLLFVYERDGLTTGGRRGPVTVAEYMVRVAQRTIVFLSTPHEAGPGYATDTRLRPSGSQGTLVSSLEAFARYHETHSAFWERQALVRARPVAGDVTFGHAVDAVIRSVAYERGAVDVPELRRLRARMELELGREDRGEVAIKYGRGALVDVEFSVQALQMTHGRDPRVRTPNTLDALDALHATERLDDDTWRTLREGEARLRAVLLATRLTTLRGALVPATRSATTVARRLGYRDRAGVRALEALLADVQSTRDEVRRAFQRVMRGLEGSPLA